MISKTIIVQSTAAIAIYCALRLGLDFYVATAALGAALPFVIPNLV